MGKFDARVFTGVFFILCLASGWLGNETTNDEELLGACFMFLFCFINFMTCAYYAVCGDDEPSEE